MSVEGDLDFVEWFENRLFDSYALGIQHMAKQEPFEVWSKFKEAQVKELKRKLEVLY